MLQAGRAIHHIQHQRHALLAAGGRQFRDHLGRVPGRPLVLRVDNHRPQEATEERGRQQAIRRRQLKGGIIIVPGNDLDGDGIPNDVEVNWGLNPTNGTDAVLDLDGDFVSNLREHISRTDGADSNSFLCVSSNEITTNGAFRLSWTAMPNVTYQIQAAQDAATQTFSTVISKTTIGLSPYTMTLDEVDTNAVNNFYRLKVE